MVAYYTDGFTWEAPYGDHAILHNDGACSCCIDWSGVDADLQTPEQQFETWTFYESFLKDLPEGYACEFHLWREWDDGPAKRYKAFNSKIVRGHEFGGRVRDELANFLAPYGISNSVSLVLVKLPTLRFGFGAKSKLLNQGQEAEKLLGIAQTLAR